MPPRPVKRGSGSLASSHRRCSLAAIGGIPGAVVGSIVGGIGLVTAVFTASGREAKLARERIEGYAEALLDIEDRLGLIGFARDTIEDRLLGEGRASPT